MREELEVRLQVQEPTPVSIGNNSSHGPSNGLRSGSPICNNDVPPSVKLELEGEKIIYIYIFVTAYYYQIFENIKY